MKVLSSILATFVAIFFCYAEHSGACTTQRGVQLKISIPFQLQERKSFKIFSIKRKCSKSVNVSSSRSVHTLILPKSRYTVTVVAPSCIKYRKSITLKRKHTLNVPLQCAQRALPTPTPLTVTTSVPDRLIHGMIGADELLSYARSLIFAEVMHFLDVESLTNVLRTLNVIAADDSIDSYLQNKGISNEFLSLKPDGMLTASLPLIRTRSISQGHTSSNLEQLMLVSTLHAQIRDYFNSDPLRFFGDITPNALNGVLKARTDPNVTRSPVLLISNELIPHYLGGNSEQISRRIPITLQFETGAKVDGWGFQALADVIRGIPEQQRAFFVTFNSGNPAETLDPLRDSNGQVIDKFPGVPHRFPSYLEWGNRVRQNLTAYLYQIRTEFHARQGQGSIARYVAIDFESIRNDWESIALYFQGNHALLLQDPRISSLKEAIELTDADILALPNWAPTDPRRIRWDAYMLSHRAAILESAIGDSFRTVFQNPDISTSNYDDALRTDTVANGSFYRKEFRTWNTIGTSLSRFGQSLSSIPMYGLHYDRISTPAGEILSDPPAPAVIHSVTPTEYYTRNNTFVTTLNRVQSINAASALRTNHYVTFKDFIDTWHNGYYGACMRFNNSTKRYERQACSDSEQIGDFMFEYWALAAQNAEFINLYTLSTSSLSLTPEHAQSAAHMMAQINRLLGFSDRSVAYDASAYINGVKTAVSGVFSSYGKPFYLWASRANNQKVFRVVFMAPNGFDKSSTVIRDGSNGDGVLISFNGSHLEIPDATIDQESLKDLRAPFGYFITQRLSVGKIS